MFARSHAGVNRQFVKMSFWRASNCVTGLVSLAGGSIVAEHGVGLMALENEKALQGWKAIADYLDCSVKTAQRREGKGLPIHRHDVLGVLAYPCELEAWIIATKITHLPPQEPPPSVARIEPDPQRPDLNTSQIGSDGRLNGVGTELSSVPKLPEWLRKGLGNWTFLAAGAAVFAALT